MERESSKYYKKKKRSKYGHSESDDDKDVNKRDRERSYNNSKKKSNFEITTKEKWGKPEMYEKKEEIEVPQEKEKPNFGTSGKLCEDTNTHKGVVVKYSEPQDAAKPIVRWRLYPFKGDEALPQIYIHRQSSYLIGKDRRIADFPVDHPSCSKQHAAFQYRSVKLPNGRHSVLLYIIDLGSTNGTYLNGEQIEASRYYELKEKDILKFGFSTREYVVLNENSCKDDSQQQNEDSDEEHEVDLTGVEDKIKQEAFSNDYGF
uniref:FHA domain-containing protein n=1 Tax=Parastrongyloides trichosuri TaxID=131310 RepID=A0A0N4Z6N7_PARTI